MPAARPPAGLPSPLRAALAPPTPPGVEPWLARSVHVLALGTWPVSLIAIVHNTLGRSDGP